MARAESIVDNVFNRASRWVQLAITREFPHSLAGSGTAGWLFGLLGVAILLRIAAMANVVLLPEEAYYWMYSQNPELSYFDHPPMVAWVIGLGTWLWGNTEFGVRFVGQLLSFATAGLLYAFGRMWFGKRAAAWAMVLFLTAPIYFGIAFIATMDSALLFFWMVCVCGVSVALKHGRGWGWYLAGAGLGGALLSKYTGIFLAGGAFVACAVHRPWRKHLRSPHSYLALLIAAVLFSPVIAWNAQHGWASFRFQFVDRYGEAGVSTQRVLTHLGLQALALSPLLFVAVVWSWARPLRRPRVMTRPRWLVVLVFSVPLFVVLGHKSLRYITHINWSAPLYLTLLPCLAHGAMAKRRLGRRWAGEPRWTRLLLLNSIACLAIGCGFLAYLLWLQPRVGWIEAFGPWRQLAAVVEHQEDRLEAETGREPLVVGDGKYRLASVLAFYRVPIEDHVDASQFTTSEWILGKEGLGYPYWSDRREWENSDCIYVTCNLDHDSHALEMNFESVKVVDDDSLTQFGPYQVVICRDLRSRQEVEKIRASSPEPKLRKKSNRKASLDPGRTARASSVPAEPAMRHVAPSGGSSLGG